MKRSFAKPDTEDIINKRGSTTLLFMIALTTWSLLEIILLKKVIKPKLIGVLVAIIGIAIIVVGHLYNLVTRFLI